MSLIRVGFVLDQDGWLGGVNYFRNLFTAIELLPGTVIQPVVFSGLKSDVTAFEGIAGIIRTSYLDRYSLQWWLRKALNTVFPWRDYLLYYLMRKHRIGLVSHFGGLWPGCAIRSLGWIPDFQQIHLPEFFDSKERVTRNRQFMSIIRRSDAVLLSSQDALNDLNNFFPDNSTPTHILRFISGLESNSNECSSRKNLVTRYSITRPWFHVPNQFWTHKNHKVLVEALHLLKKQGKCPLVISTGSTEDYRNSEYFPSLMKLVDEYALQDDFLPMGVVPYSDVMALMRYSVAVINPSLFEGWSTSVEESKAMGKMVILSDIPVHREQSPERGLYFTSDNPESLVKQMTIAIQGYDEIEDFCHQNNAKLKRTKNMEIFATRYEEIVYKVMNGVNS